MAAAVSSKAPAIQVLDVNILASAMATALSTSLTASLKPFVDAIQQEREARHGVRNEIQRVADKVSELDTEVRLLKGVQQQLMGDGTGTSGMMPSLQREGVQTRNDVSELKGDMKLVKESLARMENSMTTLAQGQSKAQSFMDGGRGVFVFLGIMATLVSIIGGVIAIVVWLYTHGATAVK